MLRRLRRTGSPTHPEGPAGIAAKSRVSSPGDARGPTRSLRAGPRLKGVLRPRALCEPLGVSEVRVPLEEGDPSDLVGVRPGVAEYVEPVPDVDDVDQTVPDDREAPHDDLVRPARERRVLVRDVGQRRGREPARLHRATRGGDFDRLLAARVPG